MSIYQSFGAKSVQRIATARLECAHFLFTKQNARR